MLELAQSLILNEEALNSLPENKRPVFIYEWLCFLNKVLIAAQKVNSNSIVDIEYKLFFFLRMIFVNVNHELLNNSCNNFNMDLDHQSEH
jgi:hypothetical protein